MMVFVEFLSLINCNAQKRLKLVKLVHLGIFRLNFRLVVMMGIYFYSQFYVEKNPWKCHLVQPSSYSTRP